LEITTTAHEINKKYDLFNLNYGNVLLFLEICLSCKYKVMTTQLIPLWAGTFKADGGALFGVIPKVLWNKEMPCDDNNFVELSLRCLLADQGKRKILIETGTGDHYPERFRQNQGLTDGQPLLRSLSDAGFSPEDITDVVFTHLHWDHANGAIQNRNHSLALTFPNASHWCSLRQWEHAHVSNPREKATFFTDFFRFMEQSGKLHLVENEGEIFPGFEVRFYDGHTPGQMIPFIHHLGRTFVYTADFIPTAAHIPLLWIASYDLYPVTTMKEKETFLTEAAEKEFVLFFEHDMFTECATVGKTGKKTSLKQKFSLSEV
jgi:glyoxylase-like metal-dependent hydrolase (beta-lactamase superfamily II)